MKRSTITLATVSFLCLLIFPGCGLIKPAQATNRDLSQWEVTDPNSIGLKKITSPDGTLTYNYNWAFYAGPINTNVFWEQEYNALGIPVVRGQINGTTYPVLFDTGNSVEAVVIEDIHVIENNLPLVLFNKDNRPSAGMAVVADFRVGPFYAENYPCIFLKNHTQIRFFGFPVSRSRHIIMPLLLMAQFKYFEFDQIKNEIRSSLEHSFEPNDPTEWISIPFKIQDNRILLSVFLEGIETTLFMDTGSGPNLMLSEDWVRQLYEARPNLKNKWKHSATTYGPYSDGLVKQHYIRVNDLKFDDFTINRCKIYYGRSYENKPYQGIVGFSLFKKTILVLDFENSLMWVKKAKDSQFEQ